MKNLFRLISKTEKKFEIIVEDSTGVQVRGIFEIVNDVPNKKYFANYDFFGGPYLVDKDPFLNLIGTIQQFINKNLNEIIKMKSSDFNVSINLHFLL